MCAYGTFSTGANVLAYGDWQVGSFWTVRDDPPCWDGCHLADSLLLPGDINYMQTGRWMTAQATHWALQ